MSYNELILHDSHTKEYRSPFGAVSCMQTVKLKISINKSLNMHNVKLIIWIDEQQKKEFQMEQAVNNKSKLVFQTKIEASSTPSLMWYYFELTSDTGKIYYGNNKESLGGIGKVYYHDPNPYQITVYSKELMPSNWFKDTIMYQIFVDRFFNGNDDGHINNPKKKSLLHADWNNDPIYIKDDEGRIIYWDFFGGNLLGVIKKLPYLKELGVNVIYFNPIFEAPSNHKYDTGDYHKVDPMYGDKDILLELIKKAKELDIYIILDGVFSHTGSDSIYFNKEGNYDSLGAYQSKDSMYYSWYRFFEYPNSYESWWGVDVLPNVNELEPTYVDFIINNENSVLNYWQEKGIKGWRLDVADELPDEFIYKFNHKLKENDKDSILIGEVWEDASNKVSYGVRRKYLTNNQLDSVTNYIFRDIAIGFLLGYKDAKTVYKILMSIYENYPVHNFYSLMNLLASHDTPRILSELQNNISEKENIQNVSVQRLKLITLWQMTFPGVPIILYGDEAGIEGINEPLNRRTYPWGKENKEILDWYKRISSIRNRYDIFKTGDFESFFMNEDVYGFYRTIKGNKDRFSQKRDNNFAIVIINRSLNEKHLVKLNIEKHTDSLKFFDIINDVEIAVNNDYIELNIEPLEGLILIEKI